MVTTRSGTSTLDAIASGSKRASDEPTRTPDRPKRPRTSQGRKPQSDESLDGKSQYGLLEMPASVFAEISRRVCPEDLISLARTCKRFRVLLMTRSAEDVWRCAESNVPDLPPYPWGDISLPQYAALVFDKTCTHCGRDTKSDADPYLLVRLCLSCRETEVVEIDRDSEETKKLYHLVRKTTMFRMKNVEGKRHRRGSGKPTYCLRTELEAVRKTYDCVTQTGARIEQLLWEHDVLDEMELRSDFSQLLRVFLKARCTARQKEKGALTTQRVGEVKRRLLALGYQESDFTFWYCHDSKWESLVHHQTRPVTDRVWQGLLPQLEPILEANRARNQKRELDARQRMRKSNFIDVFNAFMVKSSPLRLVIESLDPMPSGGPEELPAYVANFMCSLPLPGFNVISSWPWVEALLDTDRDKEELELLLGQHLGDAQGRIDEWRGGVEKKLFEQLGKSVEGSGEPPVRVTAGLLEVRGSTEHAANLPMLTRELLRADCVFTILRANPSGGQLRPIYYPEFTPVKKAMDWRTGRGLIPGLYECHIEATQVSRALLKQLEMPHAAYLELAAMGKRFACGRCWTRWPMDWRGIVQHYLDELRSWRTVSATPPRLHTRHPVPQLNVHDPDSWRDDLPLIRIVTVEEAKTMLAATGGMFEGGRTCLPCRNYSYMYTAPEAGMNLHLSEVHQVISPEKDTHYGRFPRTFLEYGKEWAGLWDSHCDSLNLTTEIS